MRSCNYKVSSSPRLMTAAKLGQAYNSEIHALIWDLIRLEVRSQFPDTIKWGAGNSVGNNL